MIRLVFMFLLMALLPRAYAGEDCTDFQELVQAAHEGDPDAQDQLGEAYFFARCVDLDLDEAMYWYFNAAEVGSDDAVYAIGLAFSSGIGLDKNAKLAKHYFERAANNGHEAAIVNLANIYVVEQFGKCDGLAEIEQMLEQVESPGIRVLFNQSLFDQLDDICEEDGDEIRSANGR